MKLEDLDNSGFFVSIDMDGVVADFDQGTIDAFGKHPDNMDKDILHDKIQTMNQNGTPFFYNLPETEDAQILWSFLKNTFGLEHLNFLTATGGEMHDEVRDQKVQWIRDHIDPNVEVVTAERSFHKGRHVKHNNHILIDDRTKSTEPWEKAGGIAILHTSAQDTIERLKKLLQS